MKKKKNNRLLGELESDIMNIIWKLETASVRDVLAKLEKKRKVAYTTVMTVMTRLVDKGILKRRLDNDGAYLYRPSQKKNDFMASASKKIVKNLIDEFGEVAVAQFIDAVEVSHIGELSKWQKKLKKIK